MIIGFFFIAITMAIKCRDMPDITKKTDYMFTPQQSTTNVYFNLCGPINKKVEGFDTSETAVLAELSQSKTNYKRLGNTTTEKITYLKDPITGDVEVHFDYQGDFVNNNYLQSRIVVKCGAHDTSSKITGKLTKDNVYVFTFTSPDVCEADNYFPIVGLVLCCILLIVIMLYFIFGLLVNTFIKQKRGIEMIPNYKLWKALPSLIKDGVIFTFTCKTSESKYEQIDEE